MAPGQQVRAFAFVLVVRPVPGRALLLGGQLGFELLDPRLECGNHIRHRQAACGPYGQRFVLQLVKINSDQGLTILVVRARQAIALDDGACALGRDVEAVANLRVGELFEHPAGRPPERVGLQFVVMPVSVHRAERGYARMVDERLNL